MLKINETEIKPMLKSELADLAGVPLSTLRVWLKDNERNLQKFNYKRNQKLLCVGIILYLNEKYVLF